MASLASKPLQSEKVRQKVRGLTEHRQTKARDSTPKLWITVPRKPRLTDMPAVTGFIHFPVYRQAGSPGDGHRRCPSPGGFQRSSRRSRSISMMPFTSVIRVSRRQSMRRSRNSMATMPGSSRSFSPKTDQASASPSSRLLLLIGSEQGRNVNLLKKVKPRG